MYSVVLLLASVFLTVRRREPLIKLLIVHLMIMNSNLSLRSCFQVLSVHLNHWRLDRRLGLGLLFLYTIFLLCSILFGQMWGQKFKTRQAWRLFPPNVLFSWSQNSVTSLSRSLWWVCVTSGVTQGRPEVFSVLSDAFRECCESVTADNSGLVLLSNMMWLCCYTVIKSSKNTCK